MYLINFSESDFSRKKGSKNKNKSITEEQKKRNYLKSGALSAGGSLGTLLAVNAAERGLIKNKKLLLGLTALGTGVGVIGLGGMIKNLPSSNSKKKNK